MPEQITSRLPVVFGDIFENEVRACEQVAGRVDNCALTGPLELEGKGSVAFDLTPVGQDFFALHDPIVVRVFRNDDTTGCTSQVALGHLNGLEGFAPKIIPITGGVREGCERRVVAMELKGDASWAAGVVNYDRGFYLRLGKLLEAVRMLHARGFVHNYISGDHVRIKRDDPNFVSLDGFDLAHANTGKGDKYFKRNSDLVDLSVMLIRIPAKTPSWVHEFRLEMELHANDARPDYEKWIEFCNSEAAKFDS